MRFRLSKRSFILISVLLLVLLLHYSRLFLPVENFVIKSITPLGAGFYHFGQKLQLLWKPNISASEYLNLREERNRLLSQNIELQFLERENQELRKALDFIYEKQFQAVTAGVIGRDPVNLNYFVLDRGLRDEVRENLPVVSPDGVLVGKIIRAEENISFMLIPTDTNFQTAGAILDKSKRSTAGLVHGEKGLGIKMEFVPQDEDVAQGDIVITSGLEMNMPRGLLVGKISEVKREARGIFNEAVISPLVAYEDLIVVMVLEMGN